MYSTVILQNSGTAIWQLAYFTIINWHSCHRKPRFSMYVQYSFLHMNYVFIFTPKNLNTVCWYGDRRLCALSVWASSSAIPGKVPRWSLVERQFRIAECHIVILQNLISEGFAQNLLVSWNTSSLKSKYMQLH